MAHYEIALIVIPHLRLEVHESAIHSVGAIRCEHHKLIRNSDPFGLARGGLGNLMRDCLVHAEL
jgi:hypothetical protein